MLSNTLLLVVAAAGPPPVSAADADGVSPWALATWLFAALMLAYFVFAGWREARRMSSEHPEPTSLPRPAETRCRLTCLPRPARDARAPRPVAARTPAKPQPLAACALGESPWRARGSARPA